MLSKPEQIVPETIYFISFHFCCFILSVCSFVSLWVWIKFNLVNPFHQIRYLCCLAMVSVKIVCLARREGYELLTFQWLKPDQAQNPCMMIDSPAQRFEILQTSFKWKKLFLIRHGFQSWGKRSQRPTDLEDKKDKKKKILWR